MKWSWKMGRFAGIDVYMHATFLLLIGWIALSHWLQARSLAATLGGIAFILALFLCVVLHEYGHALTARRFGIRTRDITLLPIGGLARLERMPEKPMQELWVALAGPAVNVALVAVLVVWLSLTGGWTPLGQLGVAGGSFAERLLVANIFLALFNLLPAFPMDGGRVLRALLASRMEYTRATRTAASVGQGMAMLFGLVGLFYNPFLVFIALFVWIGAAQEASSVQMKSSLAGIPVARAMVTDFRTLYAGDPLSRAVEMILSGSQQEFPVVSGSRVVGVLTKADLLKALAQRGDSLPVAEAMNREFQLVDSHDMLESVLERLQECRCHTLPVMHGGELVGLVTTENLGEFMLVQAALGARPSQRRVAA
ncbi:MAG: site-2 protease family protein [Bryobacteraceae bacterium]